MDEIPVNPYSDKHGNPKKGRFCNWHEWEQEHQTILRHILLLPIEERRYKAITDELFSDRMNAEGGTFFSDEERQQRILANLSKYQALEKDLGRSNLNPYGAEHDGPQLGKYQLWREWEKDIFLRTY